MDRKTLPCLQNASQHVPVYLQQFPSYSNHSCKKSPFLRTPAFIFLFALGSPLWQSRKTLHEWKDNSVLAKPLAACTYLSSIVFRVIYDVWYGKTRMAWLPDGEKISKISLFVLTQLTNVTDGHTCRHIPRLCIASRGKNGSWPSWKSIKSFILNLSVGLINPRFLITAFLPSA